MAYVAVDASAGRENVVSCDHAPSILGAGSLRASFTQRRTAVISTAQDAEFEPVRAGRDWEGEMGRRNQPMITLPMTPVAESSPITVSTEIAAIALPTHHRRRLPGPRPIHASAAYPSPSSRNHGSLKNRSCKSAARWSIDAHTPQWVFNPSQPGEAEHPLDAVDHGMHDATDCD